MTTPEQNALIKSSWEGINIDDAGRTFYVRFAEIAPEPFKLFKIGNEDPKTSAKIGVQANTTFAFIDNAVKNLNDMPAVVSSLDQLGQRHIKYGAKKAHFGPAGEALLYALEKHMRSKWTPETKAAWTAFYGVVADHISAPLS